MTHLFEERLKPIREQAGLTQQQVAEHLGISRCAYANMENLRVSMKAEQVSRFCEICDISFMRFHNWFELTEQDFIENMRISQDLASFVKRSKENREFVIWLSSQKEDFDLTVKMSVAYACMPKQHKNHISALLWYEFEHCYNKYDTPQIADKIYNSNWKNEIE